MEGRTPQLIAAILADRTRNDVGAEGVSRGVVSLCENIGAALAPIVGRRGVAVLYKRSLFLTSREHPVLSGMHEDVQSTMDPSPLAAVLASLSEAEANAVGAALLQSFYELLGSLVGTSLTERLLSALWNHTLNDQPTLETTA